MIHNDPLMGTASRLVRRTVNVLVTPASDVPGQWIAHCLELDVVTQGTTPSHAIEMAAAAVQMVIDDDLAESRDPFRSRKPAPGEHWTRLTDVLRNGSPVDVTSLPADGSIAALMVEMDLNLPTAAKDAADPLPLLAPHAARAELHVAPPSVH